MPDRQKPPSPKDAGYFLEKSDRFLAGNKPDLAIKTITKGLKVCPGDLRLSLRLGAIEMARKNFRAAISVFEASLKVNPDQPDLLYHLGMVHVSMGDGAKAQTFLEPIAGRFPKDIPLQEAFGACLSLQRKFDEALQVIRNALATATSEADVIQLHLHEVVLLQDQSRMDDAFEVLSKLKERAPENTAVLLAEAKLHSDMGNVPETEKSLQQILARSPGNVEAFVMLHKISLRDPDPTALNRIQEILADPRTDDNDRILLNFLAGEINDRLGSFNDAFRYFKAANDLRRKTSGAFGLDAHINLTERTKTVFDRELFERFQDLGCPSDRPIFIVGMPRSGTSLVEQILASHPQVHGAGEREEIAKISEGLHTRIESGQPYPEGVVNFDAEAIANLAAEYLGEVTRYVPAELRITDKMPRNFLDIGLIRILFPNSPIIHCIRDPLDTCLSCFVSNFGRRHLFSTDFSDLAAYYNAYCDLMAHWDSVLESQVHHLRYEELVAAPETEIPRLIEYCGLPWDDRCLSPHLASRPVVTSSRWQVRRPIYGSSVSRSQRYAGHLDELEKGIRL